MEMSLLKNRYSLIGFCALALAMGNPDAAAEKTAGGADLYFRLTPKGVANPRIVSVNKGELNAQLIETSTYWRLLRWNSTNAAHLPRI